MRDWAQDSFAANAGKPGKLAKEKQNIDGIRELFEKMDVDQSGTLGEPFHLSAMPTVIMIGPHHAPYPVSPF